MVEGLHKSLLGQLAIQALQLLKRIRAVERGSRPPKSLYQAGKAGGGMPTRRSTAICTQHSTECTYPTNASSQRRIGPHAVAGSD